MRYKLNLEKIPSRGEESRREEIISDKRIEQVTSRKEEDRIKIIIKEVRGRVERKAVVRK